MGTKKWRTNGQMGVIQRGATDVLGGELPQTSLDPPLPSCVKQFDINLSIQRQF